jgi:hypothetical protein
MSAFDNDSAGPSSPNNVFQGSPNNVRGKARTFQLMLIGSTFNPYQSVNAGVDFDVLTPTSNTSLTSGGNILSMGACTVPPAATPYMFLGNVSDFLPCSITGTTDSTFYELGLAGTTITNSYGTKSGGSVTTTNSGTVSAGVVSTATRFDFVGPFVVNSGSSDQAFPAAGSEGPLDISLDQAVLTSAVLMPPGTYDFAFGITPYGSLSVSPLYGMAYAQLLIMSRDGATTTVVPLTGSGLPSDQLTPTYSGPDGNGTFRGSFASQTLLSSDQEFYLQLKFLGIGQDCGTDELPGVAGTIDAVISQSLCGLNTSGYIVYQHA